MPPEYETLYAWMRPAFGDGRFTVAAFRETFPSPAPAKVLSDLHRLGYVESPRRGTYHLIPPRRRMEDLVRRDGAALGLPNRSELPHAYCEATAVSTGDVDLRIASFDTRRGDDITREVAAAFDRMLNALRFYALSDDASGGEE